MNVQKQHSICEWKCVSGSGKQYQMPPFSAERVPALSLTYSIYFLRRPVTGTSTISVGKGFVCVLCCISRFKSRYSTQSCKIMRKS